MILREIRRFFKGASVTSVTGVLVLGFGIGTAALSLSLLFAASSLFVPGVRHQGYATLAEGRPGEGTVPVAWSSFEPLRDMPLAGAGFAAYSTPLDLPWTGTGSARTLRVAAVSRGLFSGFTEPLMAGRDFTLDEESGASSHSVIVSEALARKLFGSPYSAVGASLILQKTPFQIVGVAPKGFAGLLGDGTSAWIPARNIIPFGLALPPAVHAPEGAWKDPAFFYVLAGSSRFDSHALLAYLKKTLGQTSAGFGVMQIAEGLTADPVRDEDARKWLRLGFLVSMLFTLISSLNYALLLLARVPRLTGEVQLKKALGASPRRLLAELAAGPMAMVAAGLLVGASVWLAALRLLALHSDTYGQVIRASTRSELSAFLLQIPVACLLTMVVALVPAVVALRGGGVPRLGYASTATRRTDRLLQIPVIMQIACCAGTWILAGMIVSSVLALIRAPLGYDPAHLSAVVMGPGQGTVTYTSNAQDSFPSAASIRALLARVLAVPGVRSASIAEGGLFDPARGTITLERSDGKASRAVFTHTVSPGYFQTLGASILRGEDFSWGRRGGRVRELVINRRLAEALWPGANPIHQAVKLVYPPFAGMPAYSADAVVIGVVGDQRLLGLAETPELTIFQSFTEGGFFAVTPVLIVDGKPAAQTLAKIVAPLVPTLMPGLAVQSTYSVQQRVDAAVAPEQLRACAAIAGAFIMGVVSFLGLYGSLAHYVNSRRRELAVRLCLGAAPGTIRALILLRALRCAAIAVALTVPLWIGFARLAAGEYFGRLAWSGTRALVLSSLCVGAALAIAFTPARMAASIAPAEVLREQ